MNDADERRWLIALHLVPALGAARIARLVSALGAAAASWGASQAALGSVPGIGPGLAAQIGAGAPHGGCRPRAASGGRPWEPAS